MTEDNTNNNAVFAVLKPLCDNLILNVNQQSINDLSHALSNLPPKAIQKFQTYICFPIEVQIHKSSCALKKQMLVDILKKLVSLTYIESVSMLQRLSALLFQQVTGITRDQVSVSLVPEELKLSVVQCLDLLWRSAMSDVLHQIYTREHYPQLSPVIYMLVQLVRSEKLIKLRVASLECLLVVCYIHDSADRSDIEMCHRARDVVMLMMPGIVSCCTAVASESSTQNHSITIANMRVWSSVVSLVMEDQEPAVEQVKDTTSSPSNATTAAERVQQMKQQLRTAEWLHTTAEKLTTVTDALLRAQSHTHWQVRRQLAMSTKQLLTSCPRNLSLSVGSLVCCLIVLSEDEMPEVQQPATKALQEFSQKVELDTGQPLLELVESAFFSLLTRVPRIMQGTDDNSQMTCMSLLVGFLRLQGHKLPQVLCLSSFLHRLLMTLVHVSRLDCSHISLLEDCSVREVESNQVVTESWKKLMFCDSTQKALKLQNVCAMLRLYTDLQVITHALLDLLDSNPEHSKEIIFLLNSILAGGGLGSMTDQSELIRTVVNIYLQPNVWSIPISVGNQTAITVPEAQSNIVQISLLAEGLGLFALAVGGQNFSLCLMRCLYPLLECAGSALYPLASAGLLAVQNVAQACVNGGVTELVKANVDYLSHHITIRLRRAHENPGVLSVLSVVMRHTTIQVLPSLQEIIEEVFMQSCDEFQEHNANSFLRVFLTFLMCVRGWHVNEPVHTKPSQPKMSIIEELLEYQRCLKTVEDMEDEEPVEGDINEKMFSASCKKDEAEVLEEENENEPKKVPTDVKLTVAILTRALHFLPSKDEQRQILVLDILQEGVLVLRAEEDQLLPIVHKIWNPLVNRFQSSKTQPLVMHRAFLLLCTLGSTAKDFIRSRTLKQVLPSLCRTLIASASQSLLKDSGSGYRLTQLYKLQKALLNGLGNLAIDLDIPERELNDILMAASPYLSTKQPSPLQELSRQLFSQLSTVNADLVWLQLISLWSPQKQLVPPSSQFPTFQLDTCTDDTSEFKKNVNELLKTV